MRVIAETDMMQAMAGRWRRRGVCVALVPTMGYLHAGHLSLVERARHEVGRRGGHGRAGGMVVVSIYVNPTQFGPKEDFARYPRDLKRDLALCRDAGTDVVFTPSDAAMYPDNPEGPFSTCVVEERLSQVMEGRSRPTHFRGVATVVTKLFNLVLPEVAVFGQKDWQQATILKRMVRDLNLPVKLVVAPIVRERDGLAMSSRNQYLSPDQRRQATVLWRSIQHARKAVRRGNANANRLRCEVLRLIDKEPEVRLDYVEFFDGNTLMPVRTVRRGNHMAVAAFVGRTRLIDNGRL